MMRKGPPLPPVIFIGSAITSHPTFRQSGEISDILKDGCLCSTQRHMGFEICGLPIVDTGSIDAYCLHMTMLDQPLCCIMGKTWESEFL